MRNDMDDLRVSVLGICCCGRSGFKVLSPVLQPFGLFFMLVINLIFKFFFIDIKTFIAEK